MSHILAVLATVPGREEALQQCLRSLRPQVDELRVICHDRTEAPACVIELADGCLYEPDTRGSAAKLHWAREHTGLYLGCDDDFIYPTDYVATMQRWVRRWKGRALVTCHGRVLTRNSVEFGNVEAFWPPQGATPSEPTWLNYPGGCAMAFDTRLGVPAQVPGKNLEEAHLAVWAQSRRVPIFLVPHAEGWLKYLLHERADLPTIWTAEKRAGFANRNAVLAPVGSGAGWKVYHA